MDELIEKLKRFTEERDWDQFHFPKNLAMALIVETAEIVELFQWYSNEESRNISAQQISHLEEEIGDVMIYLTNLARQFNLNPLQAAHKKIEINRKKYPIEKSKGKNVKYTDF